MSGQRAPLRRRLVYFTLRVLNKLRYFPFTVLLVLLNAAIQVIQLRRGIVTVRVGEATGKIVHLPRNAMLWLFGAASGARGQPFDLCLRFSEQSEDACLHDVFSVLVVHPRVRSIGLYWDAAQLKDDLPLWGKRQNGGELRADAPYENLTTPDVGRFEEFCISNPRDIALPISAVRDAQTLLKRQAGGGLVVCLNLPFEAGALGDAVARALPDVQFIDLAPPLRSAEKLLNVQSYFGHGYSLHERMALAHACDAYVGKLDELGCTAMISLRPCVLCKGDNGVGTGDRKIPDTVLRLTERTGTAAMAEATLRFLSARLTARS